MRAAIWTGPGSMDVGTAPDAVCPEDGVLLQVLACGICGTDVRSFYNGDRRIEALSKGMAQQVQLLGTLVHEPRLIILDEPLTGLDAGSARQVKRVLRERVAACRADR